MTAHSKLFYTTLITWLISGGSLFTVLVVMNNNLAKLSDLQFAYNTAINGKSIYEKTIDNETDGKQKEEIKTRQDNAVEAYEDMLKNSIITIYKPGMITMKEMMDRKRNDKTNYGHNHLLEDGFRIKGTGLFIVLSIVTFILLIAAISLTLNYIAIFDKDKNSIGMIHLFGVFVGGPIIINFALICFSLYITKSELPKEYFSPEFKNCIYIFESISTTYLALILFTGNKFLNEYYGLFKSHGVNKKRKLS